MYFAKNLYNLSRRSTTCIAFNISNFNIFCNICIRNEGKLPPIFMNRSKCNSNNNSKYTWRFLPFYSFFQSRMLYIIRQRVLILWIRQFRPSYSTEKKIIQDCCSLSQQFSYKFIIKVVAPCRSNSVINSPLSIKVIFSKEIVLSERNGFTVFKNDLFSTTLLAFSDGKYSFFLAFYRYDTYLFLYFWNKRLLSSCLCFREQFLNLLRIILALENSALMNVSD